MAAFKEPMVMTDDRFAVRALVRERMTEGAVLVRLDAGTTKNGDGRVFPFTTELRRVLVDQQKVADALKAQGIVPRFVFCYTQGKKAGKRITVSGFHKRWRTARRDAGCLGRIPHDFRAQSRSGGCP